MVKAEAIGALHALSEGTFGENLSGKNRGARKTKAKPRRVGDSAQPSGMTRSQAKTSTQPANPTGELFLEALKTRPELKNLRFNKSKQIQLESSIVTAESVPAHSGALESTIETNQLIITDDSSCTQFKADLNEIRQTRPETITSLVAGGSQESNAGSLNAQTNSFRPIEAAASINVGDAQIDAGEQEQVRSIVETPPEGWSPLGTPEWAHVGENSSTSSKVHRKARNAMVKPGCVSRPGDSKMTRSKTKKIAQRNGTFNLTKNTIATAKITTGLAVVGFDTEPIAVEKPPFMQPESNLPEFDNTRQAQFEIGTTSVVGAEDPRAQPKSNIPHDTRQTHSETRTVSVAEVLSGAHPTEHPPNPASEVCEKAESPVLVPSGVSQGSLNPRKTRFETKSSQHNEPLVQIGIGTARDSKQFTNWKDFQFKDQQEPSMAVETAKVLTSPNAVDFNMERITIEEPPSTQPDSNLSVPRDASQLGTSIVPVAGIPPEHSALDFHVEGRQVMLTEVTLTEVDRLDVKELTILSQSVDDQSSSKRKREMPTPEHAGQTLQLNPIEAASADVGFLAGKQTSLREVVGSPLRKRKKPPMEQAAVDLSVDEISHESESPRKRAQQKKLEWSDESIELAKEPQSRKVKSPKELKIKLARESDVKGCSTPKVKSRRTNLRSILTGKNRPSQGEPQWRLQKLQAMAFSGDPFTTVPAERFESQPSIWCETKEELVSALPELSVAVNGIAWLLSTTPVILLEDPSNEMGVSGLADDGLSFEMKTVRDFVCLSTDLYTPEQSTVHNSPTRVPCDVDTREGFPSCLADAQASNEASSESQNDSTSNRPLYGSLPSRNGSIAEDPASRASDAEFPVRPPPQRPPPVLPSRGRTHISSECPSSVFYQPKGHLRFSLPKTEHTFSNTYRTSPPHPSQEKATCLPVEDFLEFHQPPQFRTSSRAVPSTVNLSPYSKSRNAPVCLAPAIGSPAWPSQASGRSPRTLRRGLRQPPNPSQPVLNPWPLYEISYPQNLQSTPTCSRTRNECDHEEYVISYGHQGHSEDMDSKHAMVAKGKGKQRMAHDPLRTVRTDVEPPNLGCLMPSPFDSNLVHCIENAGDTQHGEFTPYPAPPSINFDDRHMAMGQRLITGPETSSFPPPTHSSVLSGPSDLRRGVYTRSNIGPPSVPSIGLDSVPAVSISTLSLPPEPSTTAFAGITDPGFVRAENGATASVRTHPPCPELGSSVGGSGGGSGAGAGADTRIPCKLPPEIVALCDTYVACTPVTVIASRAFMERRWGVSVPRECGYVYLGFFVVDALQERRVEVLGVEKEEKKKGWMKMSGMEGEEFVSGRMEWWFRFRWVPSGEEVEAQPEGSIVRPWWSPASGSLSDSPSFPTSTPPTLSDPNVTQPTTVPGVPTHSEKDQGKDRNENKPTTPCYLARRSSHPNYALLVVQGLPVHLAYHFLLPQTVRGGEAGDVDGGLPKGWWCRRCGRVNFRRFLRGGRCLSLRCLAAGAGAGGGGGDATGGGEGKAEREGEVQGGYAIELGQLRDPQQSGVLSHPANVFPAHMGVEGERTEWGDGMRAATELLRDVQIRVPLERQMCPYFTYTTPTGETAWLQTVAQAKEVMCARARVYAEREVRIGRVEICAWVVSGRRKVSTPLDATRNPVVVMLLGCEVEVTIVPRSGFPMRGGDVEDVLGLKLGRPETAAVDVGMRVLEPGESTLEPMVVDEDGEVDMVLDGEDEDTERVVDLETAETAETAETVGPGESLSMPEPMIVDGGSAVVLDREREGEIVVAAKKPGRKHEKQAVVVTLVHGDVLVLSGDVFEYSLKRVGTIRRRQFELGMSGKQAWQHNNTLESTMASNKAQPEPVQWGRLLICGGTDWPKLGKKERGGALRNDANEFENPDLLEPHILRSLANIRIRSVHSSCNGCHFVAIDIDGAAWLFGRNSFGALGIPPGSAAGDEYVSENAPMRIVAHELGAKEGTRFVHAACGRNHTILVGSDGGAWSAGQNNLGQVRGVRVQLITGVGNNGDKEHIVKASAGATFSLVLTDSGKIFSFGSAQNGQLGNGTTGERITTGNKTAYDIEVTPVYIKELDGKHIIDIVSGPQHSLALDDTGIVYVWGYNGYCRLGLGNQVDVLKPKAVPQFAGPGPTTTGALIAAGPSNSVVVDKQGMFWMAGKWKNSGEGSAGSPYSTFRFMQDIQWVLFTLLYRDEWNRALMLVARLTGADDTVMTVGWGQNAANGELGLGPDEPKSATKPTRVSPLSGIEILE
ncbi:hypothetical protein C0992_010948 [Termitomyces sp. T32_za158]|nr:hypothetical protein C0992_010948 [Termitomyces sp. T32_za158]